VEWRAALDDAGRPLVFNVEYAVGCMFDLDRADQVERAVADTGRADELYRRTMSGLTAPIEVDGEVVAVAFNNGMGESSNSVFVGLDAQGRAVAAWRTSKSCTTLTGASGHEVSFVAKRPPPRRRRPRDSHGGQR
jgi:hypothetical protein